MYHNCPFDDVSDMQKKIDFFNKRKSNSNPLVDKRSTRIEAFKHLYLTVTLKVVTHETY